MAENRGAVMKYRLQDLIDIEQFQGLQNSLNDICPLASAIVDNAGNVLTATPQQEICAQFHRLTGECGEYCLKSSPGRAETDPAVVCQCAFGLACCAAPIIMDGAHLGDFLAIQFFQEDPDQAFFRAQAGKYGFQEGPYLEAVKRVPVWSPEKVGSYLFVAKNLIDALSKTGLDRLRAMEADQKSEEREKQFRAMFDTASIGIGQADPATGRFVRVNQKLCDITGYTAEGMLAMRIADITHPEDRARDWDAFQGVIRGDAPNYQMEKRYIRKDGGAIWVSVNMTVIRDDAGQPVRAMATIEDITGRKNADAKARRLTQLYAAMNQCNEAIQRAANEEELFWQVCRDAVLFGGLKMAWIGLVDRDTQRVRPAAYYGEGVDYLKHVEISANGGTPFSRGPTGTSIRENRPFWCQDFQHDPATAPWHEQGARFGWASSASLPLLSGGSPVGSLTLYSDTPHAFDEDMRNLLTEMVADINFALDHFAGEAKRRLVEEKNSQLAAIVQYSDDAIIGKDMEGIIASWNKGAERIYGYKESEAVGKPINMLVPLEYSDEIPRFHAMIARGEHVEHFETVRRRKNGTHINVSLTISPVRNAEETIIGASTTARDITDRKRADEERSRLEAQLQQAQKMESVGRLAGGVAHDFNNMLAVILGHTEIALGEAGPNQALREDLDEIRKAAERSAELTRQLLTFARKQTVAPKVLDLNETVAGMLKMLQRIIGEDIRLEWHPSSILWAVKVDPSQVDQVLANLCVNARDAIADVGRITIETGNRTFDGEYCANHGGCRRDGVHVRQGCGCRIRALHADAPRAWHRRGWRARRSRRAAAGAP